MPITTFNDYNTKKVNEEGIDIQIEVPQNMLPVFFGKLFQSRDVAHLIHLSTQIYEQHIALNDYYDGIVGLTDDLIEGYQGLHGIIPISIPESVAEDPLVYFTDLFAQVQRCRKCFVEPNLQNIVDEISSLISKLLYKLKFLH